MKRHILVTSYSTLGTYLICNEVKSMTAHRKMKIYLKALK